MPFDHSSHVRKIIDTSKTSPPSWVSQRFPSRLVPHDWHQSKHYWTIEQELSLEATRALFEATLIKNRLRTSGILHAVGLNPMALKHQALNGHEQRVAILSLLFNDNLEEHDSSLAVPSKKVLAVAALHHDIGKLDPAINQVVMTDQKYNERSLGAWGIIKRHPEVGAKTAFLMTDLSSGGEQFRVADAIYQHHENFDGTGYYGMTGNEICSEAQIIRLADTITTMGEPRGYAPRVEPPDTIMDELEKEAHMFHPEILEAVRRHKRISGVFTTMKPQTR